MHTTNDLCNLDYFVGTLSTAYKGPMRALAAKEFCMQEEGMRTIVKGTVLSMPDGDYEASLIRSGAELARTRLVAGYFALEAESAAVKEARDLQIDILQQGRHLGTFLLKREKGLGFYVSALELSQELQGLDLKQLTVLLRDKIGLQRKAEDLVTRILSAKKDWDGFSELLHGFAIDIFWDARDAFFASFAILVRFSLKAAREADVSVSTKSLANALDMIGLPLADETGDERLCEAAGIWLGELQDTPVDLSQELGAATRVLTGIMRHCPQLGIGPVMAELIASMQRKNAAMPVLGRTVLAALKGAVGEQEYELLFRYREEKKQRLSEELSQALVHIQEEAYDAVISFLAGLDQGVFDDKKMIEAFYAAAAGRLSPDTTDAFAEAAAGLFPVFPVLSRRALAVVQQNAPALIKQLVAGNRVDVCLSLLNAVAALGSPVWEEIIMHRALASAILRSGSNALISRYTALLEGIVIPAATVVELSSETWAEIVNPLHLERLARFMDILELGGDRLQSVLLHVIANLFVSGVFIPDDRLFQRRITAYLNSEAMLGSFLYNYLLLSRLPVYYHEVGAVNAIRDLSTELDSWGNDPLLYFIRKQVHVNASNYNVRLLERVVESWVRNDPLSLRGSVPPEVYASLKPALFERYAAAVKPFLASLGVLDEKGLQREKLASLSGEKLRLKQGDGEQGEIESKIELLLKLYGELVKKKHFWCQKSHWW